MENSTILGIISPEGSVVLKNSSLCEDVIIIFVR